HRLWQAAISSSHSRASRCRRAASGPPPESTAPSSTPPSRSTESTHLTPTLQPAEEEEEDTLKLIAGRVSINPQ
ncbi:hypothetical protein BHE74_00057018, partial [Ensete ventricosum]